MVLLFSGCLNAAVKGVESLMQDMPYKDILLVCDMDHTLLDSHSTVSERNRVALIKFVESGGHFTIATGRMEGAVKPYISGLPIDVPAILYNGARIYDFKKNEIVWQKCLENNIVDILKDLYNCFEDIGIEIYNGYEIYIVRENIEIKKHIIKERTTPVTCKLEEVPLPWVKVILACEHKRLKEIENYLKDKASHFRTVFSEPQFLELLHSSVSKGDALNRLKDILGYSYTRTVSVGDNLNDVELIRNAEVGIAVGNSHPYLMEIADMCCCHNDDDAVAQVIEWIEQDKLKVKV